jgi:hypothetical protein
MNSIEELKKIAEAAMRGPWVKQWRRGYRIVTEPIDGDDETDCELIARVSGVEANARHISAFNPHTVLALIADWEKMRNTLKSTVGHEPFGKGDLNPYKISECLQSLQFKKGE